MILIDDGSDDRTLELVAALPITLIRHATPLGKGQALRDGFREARELGFDAVSTMDGDGQHLATDIPRIARRGAALSGPHRDRRAHAATASNQPNGRRRANAFADWGISWGCGMPVADTQSGQRWYPLARAGTGRPAADDFVFEAAILIAACREKQLGVVSVPIDSRYHGRVPRQPFPPGARRDADHLLHGRAHPPLRPHRRQLPPLARHAAAGVRSAGL